MPFHYQRAPGEQGGVGRGEGEPPGTRLSDLLAAGLPTERAALEIGVALCEIAYIAEDDGNTHGDLSLSEAWLTGDGVVAIGGYGVERARTRAPEGAPRGPATDRYGLGLLLASLLVYGSNALFDLPKHEAPAHDQQLEDWLDRADLGDLPESTDHEVRRVIGHLLMFDRLSRSEALSVWRVLRAHAPSLPGPPLRAWAEAAHRGTAHRREARRPGDERLGRAEAQPGPLTKPLAFSAHATRTQYWRLELEEQAPNGGDKSGRWTLGELRAMWKEATGDTEPSLTDAERRRSFRPEEPRPSRTTDARPGPTIEGRRDERRAERREVRPEPPVDDRSDRRRGDRREPRAEERREPPRDVRRDAAYDAGRDAAYDAGRGAAETSARRDLGAPNLSRDARSASRTHHHPPAEASDRAPLPDLPRVEPPDTTTFTPTEAPAPRDDGPEGDAARRRLADRVARTGVAVTPPDFDPPQPPDDPPPDEPEASGSMPVSVIVFLVVSAVVFFASCMILVGVLYWVFTKGDLPAGVP